MVQKYVWIGLFLLAILGGPAFAQERIPPETRSPYVLFPGLFEQVQTSGLFSDSKTFADGSPRREPSAIMADFNSHRNDSAFDLRSFVEQNFSLPETIEVPPLPRGEDVAHHIERLWDVLTRPGGLSTRGSLIGLSHSYVVPGGRFREIYYWDSYFTMLGLKESGRKQQIADMVSNFASLIRSFGFIPNGNRTYYLTRSQPPYFSLMVQLLLQCDPGKSDSVLAACSDALEAEYRFWMAGRTAAGDSAHVVHLPDGSLLNRYYDRGDWPREESFAEDVATARASGRPAADVYRSLRSGAESGWDFSSRWLSDGHTLSAIHTTDFVPVDLNCLLYHLETLLSQAVLLQNDIKKYHYYVAAATTRKKAIRKYCWDEKEGWFCDFNYRNRQRSPEQTLAGVYPLFFNIATNTQAAAIARKLQQQFLKPGGLVTSLKHTGQQWDAPNGWAPLQWTAIQGLRNYGLKPLSDEIAKRWSRNNIRVFEQTGKLMEKYNVEDTTLRAGGGEYPTQDGFGWTNGVLLCILKGK